MCGGNIIVKKKILILWIDDDPNRNEDAINISDKIDHLEVEFILAEPFIDEKSDKKHSFINLVKNKQKRPDLFFIDYRLDRNVKGKISRRGWSVASQIRETMPDVPIYGVSALDYTQDYILKAYEKEYFDKLLNMTELEESGSKILYYDSLDFYNLRNAKKKDVNVIFKLLKIPESSKSHIIQILPEIFSKGINDFESGGDPQSNSILFGRWVIRELLSYPGPLYNRLYTETHLGVTDRGFKKIDKEFEKAEYKGIFSKGFGENRWWVSELDRLLFSNKKAKKFNDISPWVLAPKIFNIKEKTKCIVCNGDYPETIGINRDNVDIREPVHYSCSISHPTIKRKIFYDDIRTYPID